MMPSSSSVAAVVVTFNRLDKLKTSIQHLQAQSHEVDRIIVVDNASTDGTAEYLSELSTQERIDVLTLPENVGGAGGFAAGMEQAVAVGADFAWVMDDDCYPNRDSLERLLHGYAASNDELVHDVPFACSLVTTTGGRLCEMNNPVTNWDWPRMIALGEKQALIRECTFVSVLVPIHMIQKVGLPLSEYFIWFDDKEYTLRLSKRFGPGIIVLDSVVVHDMGVNKGVNYGLVRPENYWKFRYGTRNQASYRFHYEGVLAYLQYWRRVTKGMKRGKVGRRLKIKMRGRLIAGLFFNPTPRFPALSQGERETT